MGKWSPNYTDSELQTKISTLVTGALRRAAVDNDSSVLGHMTYENFVKDLDAGDSFTATMLDILVKEYADRRIRPSNDRRYISPRTMKSLRQLAAPLSQYQPRMRTTIRRPLYTSNVILPYEEEDDFGSMVDEATEGGVAPGSASLADAIPGPWYPGRNGGGVGVDDFGSRTGVQMRVRSPAEVSTATASGSGSAAPTASRASPAPWNVLPAPATVTRQASIRRPFMNSSRNIEFNNFTRRHRLNHREMLEGDGDVTVTEPRDDSLTTRGAAASSSSSGATTRRFFPLRTRVRAGVPRVSVPASDGSSSDEDLLWQSPADGNVFSDSLMTFLGNPPTFGAYANPASGSPPVGALASTSTTDLLATVAPSALTGSGESSAGSAAAPRLRRGGVRAPEAMGSTATTRRGASSPSASAPVAVAEGSGSGSGSSASAARDEPPPLFFYSSSRFDNSPADADEPAAYPTPGSMEEGEHLT